MRHKFREGYVKIEAVEVSNLQTLYIDVYFLLNFTVDIISAFFALRFSRLSCSLTRLVLSSALLALSAVLIIFIEEYTLVKYALSVFVLFISSFIIIYRVSLARRMKYILSFLIFEGLVGGITSFFWELIDKHFADTGEGGVENSSLLFFALIVLLSIGVFKMIISFFSNIEGEKSVKIRIELLGMTLTCEAFVDNGNMATDPMDMRPVLILKPDLARSILPENVVELSDTDNIERNLRKRIRLIPISSATGVRVLTGVRPDKVYTLSEQGETEIFVTLAIDKEGGDFGGYPALMPSVAICDAFR
jgi:sigma-E processing peptidase SpoIIGA